MATATLLARIASDVTRELAELQLLDTRARRCAITSAAVALATVVAWIVRVDASWWAAISAFVSIQATSPASVRRGALRIAGTAIGAGVALILSPWLVDDPVALDLALLVASTGGILGFLLDRHGYAWLLGAVTIDMVLLGALSDPLSALDTACNRTAEW